MSHLTLSWKLEATYAGTPRRQHHLLLDVEGDIHRDHAWVNGPHGNWPEGIPIGARVRFFASPHFRPGGARLTDIREIEVISHGGRF